MKRVICVFLVCLLSVMLVCSSLADGNPVTYTDKDIQINLTGMSGTVVYSMIYNIMSDPSKFVGRVVCVEGYYSAFENPALNVVYHSCVIPDATACCAQGIEFVWSGNHIYPMDYPEFGTDMVVTGRLETYMEGDYEYVHLVDAEVKWMAPEV